MDIQGRPQEQCFRLSQQPRLSRWSRWLDNFFVWLAQCPPDPGDPLFSDYYRRYLSKLPPRSQGTPSDHMLNVYEPNEWNEFTKGGS